MAQAQVPEANWIPDEICIVVSGDDFRQDAYTVVRDWLNLRVGQILEALPAGLPADPFDRDLFPEQLRENPISARLSDLRRPNGSPAGSTVFPGARSVAHFFYQVHQGLPAIDPEDQTGAFADYLIEANERIRELVILINFQLVRPAGAAQIPGAGTDVRLEAATPNWASVPAETCGGPSGGPLLEPNAQDWHITFPDAAVQAIADAGKAVTDPGVVVAVLDTSPEEVLRTAALKNPAWANHRLLKSALDPSVAFDLTPSLPPPALKCNWCGPNHSRPLSQRNDYLIPDHGLFVTGIIRDILPTVPVTVFRVLDEIALGDLESFDDVLQKLPQSFPGHRIVANASLRLCLQTHDDQLRTWLPHSRPDENAAVLEAHRGEIEWLQAQLARSAQDAVDWVHGQGVLVVAAAGNDATAGSRPEPAWPARNPRTFSVAAVTSDPDKPAEYSNLAVAPGETNGIATWGGEAAFGGHGCWDVQAADALRGLWISPSLPALAGGHASQSGWSQWAGTSFATPIISALAAAKWATDTKLTNDDVRKAIQSVASATGATVALGADVIAAQQS